MDLLREITEEYNDEPIDIMEAVSLSVKQLQMAKKGGKVTNKMVKDFIKKNPSLTAAATVNALSAYQMYKTNKRNTVTLFAKSAYDKRMVSKIVDSMVKSKQFKVTRSRYADGGKYYELKKIKAGF